MAKRKAERRGAMRRSTPTKDAYEVHEASWNGKAVLRGKKLNKQAWYVDGRKLREYLAALSSLTGDVRFDEFARLLEEYAIGTGTPAQQSAALLEKLRPPFSDRAVALEYMCMEEREARQAQRHFSASASAARIVDELNVPGPSFAKAVEELRKEFGRLDDAWRAPTLGKSK